MAMTIGECCQVFAGSPAPQDKAVFVSEGIPFVRAGSLKHLCSGGNLDDCEQINREIGTKLKLKLAPAGTILFAKSGMSAMKDRVYCLPREAYVVSHLAGLIPNVTIDSRYLSYWFLVNPPSRLINDPAYPSIRLSDISKIKFDPPSLNEQKKIAAILDKANEIEEQSKKTTLMRNNLIVSTFLEMFGDPVVNPKQWKLVSMKDLADKIGSGATPRGGKKSYVENGISLVRSMNIHDDRFVEKDLAKITDEQANLLNNVILNENDVLLNITGASVCRCAIVPSQILPARVNQHVCILRPKTTIIKSEYLLHCLISANYKKMLLQLSGGGGATREALTKEQIKHLQIPIPPIEMQNKFVKFIQSVNDLTLSANRKIQSNKDLCNSAAQLIYNRYEYYF